MSVSASGCSNLGILWLEHVRFLSSTGQLLIADVNQCDMENASSVSRLFTSWVRYANLCVFVERPGRCANTPQLIIPRWMPQHPSITVYGTPCCDINQFFEFLLPRETVRRPVGPVFPKCVAFECGRSVDNHMSGHPLFQCALFTPGRRGITDSSRGDGITQAWVRGAAISPLV